MPTQRVSEELKEAICGYGSALDTFEEAGWKLIKSCKLYATLYEILTWNYMDVRDLRSQQAESPRL